MGIFELQLLLIHTIERSLADHVYTIKRSQSKPLLGCHIALYCSELNSEAE